MRLHEWCHTKGDDDAEIATASTHKARAQRRKHSSSCVRSDLSVVCVSLRQVRPCVPAQCVPHKPSPT